ncbi:hypothetical protein ACNITL_27025, partial [Escherichia coli]
MEPRAIRGADPAGFFSPGGWATNTPNRSSHKYFMWGEERGSPGNYPPKKKSGFFVKKTPPT